MEIKVQAKSLAAILKTAAKVTNSKNALPILGDILFETKNDVLMATVSDGEQWLSQKCQIISYDQEFRFCVNASDFLNAINNIGDLPFTITLDESTKTITCNYGNGNLFMPYEDASEYPLHNMNTEDSVSFIVDCKKLLNGIELTGFATANSEVRPIMNGIHFDFFEDGMVCVACCLNVLARYKDKTITNTTEDGVVPRFTLPKKTSNILVTLLSALDGNVKLSFNNRAITVTNKDFKLTARLLEFKYPNYESLIPTSCQMTVTADKISLLNAIRRVMPMADDMSNLVKFEFERGQVTVSAEDVNLGKSASEIVTCDCEAEMVIGFNGAALVEVLKNISDDNVVIELSDPSRAVVFYSAFELTRDEYLSLCMPMLIQ